MCYQMDVLPLGVVYGLRSFHYVAHTVRGRDKMSKRMMIGRMHVNADKFERGGKGLLARGKKHATGNQVRFDVENEKEGGKAKEEGKRKDEDKRKQDEEDRNNPRIKPSDVSAFLDKNSAIERTFGVGTVFTKVVSKIANYMWGYWGIGLDVNGTIEVMRRKQIAWKTSMQIAYKEAVNQMGEGSEKIVARKLRVRWESLEWGSREWLEVFTLGGWEM
jgi:hypothetical protein